MYEFQFEHELTPSKSHTKKNNLEQNLMCIYTIEDFFYEHKPLFTQSKVKKMSNLNFFDSEI